MAIGFKMNLFNIGVDGQYRLAALFAAAAGAALDLPAPFQISVILLVAMAVGGAYAAIPGVLKVTRGVNEVVSTIMLNFVATGITAYLLANNFRNEAVTLQAETEPLPPSGRLPPMNGFLEKFGIDLPEPLTGLPALRHRRRHRLLRDHLPHPLRLRPADLGQEPERRPLVGREPEGDDPEDDDPLRA